MQIEINKVYNMDCIENMRKWAECEEKAKEK